MTDLADARPATQAPAPVTSAPPHPGMVWVPGGTFLMGSDQHYAEERPPIESVSMVSLSIGTP